MPSKRRQKRNKDRKEHRSAKACHGLNALPPAPMLMKADRTFKGFRTIGANGGSVATCRLGWNGFRLDNVSLYECPQVSLFNQFAAMFEFYQVTHVHGTFVPYKWEFKDVNSPIVVHPILSIIDPEDQGPLTQDQYMAYGNCDWTKPYDPHRRGMSMAMNLMLQKQDKQILKTNGSWASREQYVDPTTICWIMPGQTRTPGDICGTLLYHMSFVFSGQKAVGSSASQVLNLQVSAPVQQVQGNTVESCAGADIVESVQSQRSTLATDSMPEPQNVNRVDDTRVLLRRLLDQQ